MIRRFESAALFMMAAGPFLASREAQHNLLYGITSNLIADEAHGAAHEPRPYLAVVSRTGGVDAAERVVAAAMMTPPFNVVISHIDDDEVEGAVAELAADLATFETPPPGVSTAEPAARAFAEAWCAPRGLESRLQLAERIYQCSRVVPPTGVPGQVRIATVADRELLVLFVHDFLVEALTQTDPSQAQALVDRGLDRGQRTFYLWEDEGRVVSMAASAGPTPNGIRIGPVYTPPDARGHGYGSAVTAAATQAELEAGRRFVFLFTDLSNPTSNKIYQAIGYEPVADVDILRFEVP
jgi:predicted GNAT family acetyltransferase